MKKKMYRVIAILVGILLMATLAVGCQPKTSSQAKDTGAATQAQTTEKEEELKPVTLKFYFLLDKKQATDDVWKAIEEKTKDKLNAKFEIYSIPYNDFVDKIQMMIASGDNYDMNFDADWLAYPKVVSKDGYLDVKDILPKYAPQLYKEYQDLNIIGASSVNGKMYAMPWTVVFNARPVMWWDKEKFGADKPNSSIKTIEELDQFLTEARKSIPATIHMIEIQDVDITSIGKLLLPKYEYVNWQNTLMYSLNDPAAKLMPFEQTEMFKEVAKYAKKWVDEGIIPKDLLTNPEAHKHQMRDRFGNISSTWEYTYYDYYYKNNWFGYSELYPDKKYPNDTPLRNMMCINRNAANPERTLMFLEMLSIDKSLYDLVINGIEGKTYVKKGDQVAYPDGMTAQNSNYIGWGGQWGFWRANLTSPTPERPKELWDFNSELLIRPTSVNAPLDGFFPNLEKIKTEYAKRSSLFDELGKPILYGLVKDPDKAIAEYIEKQKAAGADMITEEIQKQIEAFLAGKK